MWIYIVDMHFHILADVFFFDNMNYSSKLFNPTSFVIEPFFNFRSIIYGSGHIVILPIIE